MHRVAVVLLVLLALAACGDDGEDVGTGDGGVTEPTGADDPLAGRTFASGPGADLVEGTELRLRFEEGRLGLQAGCNHLSGGYTLEGETLVVEPLEGTEMGCDPELMDQDARLARLFAEPVGWALDGDTLTLTAPDGTYRLLDLEVASPDLDLVGPTWTLDTLTDGDTASSVPTGVTATITFDADGELRFDTGCNDGAGTHTAPDDSGGIVVEGLSVEEAGCEDGRGTVEEAVLSTLRQGTLTVALTEQRLTLTAADASGLGFTAG